MTRIGSVLEFGNKKVGLGVRKFLVPQTLNNLKYSPLKTDCVDLRKSPLDEFKNYMLAIEREGKNFKPKKTDSLIGKYAKVAGENSSLYGYKNFIFQMSNNKKADDINVSKEEYYELVDEVAKEIQNEVRENPGNLRKEFINNADRIHKWAEIFATQHFENGKNIYSKFYDEKMYNNAVKEYTEFVEKLTGKKVLIGCKSRMNFPISALGMFNNPKAYKDVDYILLGHGKYSSLITDTQKKYTWRFKDNNKSIYEFIEENVPKGKKVMVFCCESKKSKNAKKLFDRKGQRMYGIGEIVLNNWEEKRPVKLCESGVRHVIGHIYSPDIEFTDIGLLKGFWKKGGFTLNIPFPEPKVVYYDLDFSKFKSN